MNKLIAYLIQIGLPILIGIICIHLTSTYITDGKYFDSDSFWVILYYIPSILIFYFGPKYLGKLNWIKGLKT